MDLRRTAVIFGASAALAAAPGLAAQYSAPSPAPSPEKKADQPAHAGHETAKASTASGATMTAKLVDPMAKARKQAATVQVTVAGIRIIDPARVNEQPRKGQGHLHYQVDDGPVIATTAPKLSFHGLKAGAHTITVSLAANDHSPLGPEERLDVTIP
jgi:hypothetical protein